MTLHQSETLDKYRAFLRAKATVSRRAGFDDVTADEVHPFLKPHQRDSVLWMVRGGRRALFSSFGLGKSVTQMETLRLILKRVEGRGLIVMPLGVRQEFARDAKKIGLKIKFIRRIEECATTGLYMTNYETVRDGKLDPAQFVCTSLDEAAVLRGFGGTKTFREFMKFFAGVKYRFVATATPDPNEYLELAAYADYLGIMETGEIKTRFFKRDSTKADKLTLHPHKEQDFWLWVATWALFLQKPSDLGYDDTGYALPELRVHYHEVKANDEIQVSDKDGQMRMYRDSRLGVVDAAREKRESLDVRIEAMKEILSHEPAEHFLLWHDQDAERDAIKRAVPTARIVTGNQSVQSLDDREKEIIAFSNGKTQYLAAKPILAGSGCNFQYHCSNAIFVGIGFKFAEFIQACHRVYRFLQQKPVDIHLIYCESEREVLKILMKKWEQHKEKVAKMSEIIREYGLSELAIAQALTRSMGTERVETHGGRYRLVNNDSVEECLLNIDDESVGLVLTSIPFSTQYEYSPSYNDFGNSEDNSHFFDQMDFLAPELMRVLKPGRVAAIHVKDRIVPGGINKMGFQTLYPFHCDAIAHYLKHGFAFMGMKTVVTDVVRENNQTYRLGWSEQCKDGTKMGVGTPEYLLLFRKPPSDLTNSYADERVVKSKRRYSRSRWQIDAHGFTRSSGNRPLTPDEILNLPHDVIFRMFRAFSLNTVYDFEHHVHLGQALERWSAENGHCTCKPELCKHGRLPVTFMLLQPPSWHPDVWTDITRMLTLNGSQHSKGKQMHLCPMQLDLARRVIEQFSNPDDVVLDPFAGLGTVPMCAVEQGRIGWGIELNHGYFVDSAMYCKSAEEKFQVPTLFDLMDLEQEDGGERGAA